MRVLGIDPGSKSFDLFGYEFKLDEPNQREIFIEKVIKTNKIFKDPNRLFKILDELKPLDLIVAPSGFGIPLKQAKFINDDDVFQMTLRRGKSKPTMGLGKVIQQLRSKKYPAIYIPSIKHLPTVPLKNVVNKIDLGTSDKLCSAVLGIEDMRNTNNLPLKEVSFIMIEVGGAFSAVTAIKEGKIIDGIGGTNIMGMEAGGALDGEIAYLMGKIKKRTIYSGGAQYIGGEEEKRKVRAKKKQPPQTDTKKKQRGNQLKHGLGKNKAKEKRIEIFIHHIKKAVFSLLVNYNGGINYLDSSSSQNQKQGIQILLSGRMIKDKLIRTKLKNDLSEIGPVKIMETYSSKVKRAAQGAAIIGEGLLGGPSKSIIENLQIKKAQRHILDNIYFE